MPFPFLQKSHPFAARLLHKAGLTVTQIPVTIEVARATVETWLGREMEKGNTASALSILRVVDQQKNVSPLYAQLRELLQVKLMIHLGLKNALAENVSGLVLPFILKRLNELQPVQPLKRSPQNAYSTALN